MSYHMHWGYIMNTNLKLTTIVNRFMDKAFDLTIDFDMSLMDINDRVNDFILECLRDYCNNSAHFTTTDLRIESIPNDGDGITCGVYKKRDDVVILAPFTTSYIYSIDDIEELSGKVDTYLHEHRHVFQFKDASMKYLLEAEDQYFANISEEEFENMDPDDQYLVYYNNPMEIDAREYAAKYTIEAIEYIQGRLEQELDGIYEDMYTEALATQEDNDDWYLDLLGI